MTYSSLTKMKLDPALKKSRNICRAVTIIMIILTCFDVAHAAEKPCNKKPVILQNPTDGVCSGDMDGNIDIRNNVTNFRKLENCTVVEGSVHISLILRTVASEFESYSFPLLREITGHLMLFRVHGLRSLKNIFPNLAIIRGQDLFYNYALVAYEMRDLEEIGLINLRTIVRGGVRITKNDKLCYVDTIDWSRIAIGVDASEHHFMDNKPEMPCADYCPENCPTTTVDDVSAKRCWTSQHCQKNLKCNCGTNNGVPIPCMDNGTCCNEYCLGGCTGPGTMDCLGCKGVIYQKKCQPRCPTGTFMFSETRCLTDKECLGLKNRFGNSGMMSKLLEDPGGQNQCVVKDCPSGYTVAEEGELKGLNCVRCKDFCPIVCNSSEIHSIQDLEGFKGCNKVIGDLVIQIMGGSIVAQELENLSQIREVTGYVHIQRSYALLHLYFLKNLTVIGGDNTIQQGNSLLITDNMNLQELFVEGQKIKIKKGKVSFHGNSRLCPEKIWNFVNTLNLTETPTIADINDRNGDMKPCGKKMNLTVAKIRHDSAVLTWDTDKQDLRQLLTYNIIYKEVGKDETNVNIYAGRDACSDDVWMKREQPPTNKDPFQLGLIPDLKPYTKYVVYVQSFTLTSAAHSAMTDLVTFFTKPYYPTEPLDLQVAATDNPTELQVKWKPPKNPNGEVTHYTLFYKKVPLNPEPFEQRDYCKEPLTQPDKKNKATVKEEEKKLNVSGSCCPCPKSIKERQKERDKKALEVFFENHLQNNVYCKRYDTLPQEIDITDIYEKWEDMNRKKGDQMNITAMERILAHSANNSKHKEDKAKKYKYDNVNIGNMDVYNTTETVIPNLEAFMEYQVEILACQDTNPDRGVESKLCSNNRAITVGRTKASWVQDIINETTISVEPVTNTTSDVIIRWASPPNPNGLIITYTFRFERAHPETLLPREKCINRKLYKVLNGYRLRGLDPGNWTFQIRADSLAGNNSFTKPKFFVIPQQPGESDQNMGLVIGIIIVFFVLLLIFLLVIVVIVKHRFNNGDMTVISQNMNYLASSDLIDTMDGWEVDRDKIRILQPLGKGSFGMVYKGIAKGIRDQDPEEELWVAIKTVNDRANFFDRREFLKEATTMKAFDCYHVVKLLGVVSTGQPALVIMELMDKDLKNYLRERRPEELAPGMSPPRIQDILLMAGEIADGMAYLADKKFVHRDLAARNCMVAEDSTVKIGDFGMARDIYETDYYRKGGRGMLPVRWMAPESLRDGVFTTTSDVWSYGVVIWEMVTLAAQPYQGLSNEEVVKFISDGKTMAVPDQCPEQMEKLMMRCWRWKQRERPSFIEIIQYLDPYLSAKFKEVSFYFSGGPHRFQGDGGGTLGSKQERMDKDEEDSLSQKGAAALPQDYDYQSSPHGGEDNFCSNLLYRDANDFRNQDVNNFCHQRRNEAGSYRDDMDWEGSSQLNESFEDGTHFVYNCDEDELEVNDSQCFLGGEYRALMGGAPASISSSSSLREDPISSSNHSSQKANQGLFELQPLIAKDSSSPSSAANPHNLPSLHPKPQSSLSPSSPPDYIGFHPSQQGTNNKNSNAPDDNSQSPHPTNEPVLQPMATPCLAGIEKPAGQSSRPSGSTSLTSSSRPSLRLPVLNQPPGGVGFRPRPFDSGIRNINSSQNLPPARSSSNVPLSNVSVNVENNSLRSDDDLPPVALVPSPNHPPSSPSGAIDSLSSDGSKESTKSSGSHSLMNGLTNGHAPSSSMQHRTALC